MVARREGLLTVVVVDDDPDVRSVMRMAFEADGRFLVLAEAEGALEGVRLASSWQPDAILLDVRMPEVDGLSILPDIRRQAPDAKVLVFSVLDEELMRPQLEAAGAMITAPKERRPSRSCSASPHFVASLHVDGPFGLLGDRS